MEVLLMTAITALISSVVGAIVGALVSKVKTVRRDTEKAEADAKQMIQLQKMNLLMTCRLVIYDEHFSIEEKLDAYLVYRDWCHANHLTKKHMDDLVGCDVDEYLERHKVKGVAND